LSDKMFWWWIFGDQWETFSQIKSSTSIPVHSAVVCGISLSMRPLLSRFRLCLFPVYILCSSLVLRLGTEEWGVTGFYSFVRACDILGRVH
jgi:hypothetical protein